MVDFEILGFSVRPTLHRLDNLRGMFLDIEMKQAGAELVQAEITDFSVFL